MTDKKINILIGIPSPDSVPPDFALFNLPSLISYTKENLPNIGNLTITYQTGVRTDRNRNQILKRAIEDGTIDYILWLDTDMLFPKEMIVTYLANGEFDVMGCLYFKRSAPYSPVAYVNGDNPLKPFHAIDPAKVPPHSILEVNGLGYGGMMVNMKVYKALGDKKWTNYGKNFHLPFDTEDGLTHDLVFCKDAEAAGFKIMLHTDVKPGHIATYVVTEADYFRENTPKDAEFLFTKDWFSMHISDWDKYLPEPGSLTVSSESDMKILEIGSFEGRSAIWFLERYKNAFITCVDPFISEHNDGRLRARFEYNLAPYSGRFFLHPIKSEMFFDVVEPVKFDIIYVDGSHNYEDCLSDCLSSFKLLKVGGTMIMDDYIWGDPKSNDTPRAAIDKFLSLIGDDSYRLVVQNSQVIIIKTDPNQKQEKETDPKVVGIMPVKPEDQEKGTKVAELLKSRAGYENYHTQVSIDADRAGWARCFNEVVKVVDADYYVYLAADVFPGRQWLKLALDSMKKSGKKFLVFNDGKWQGRLAAFAIFHKSFIDLLPKDYEGNPFYSGYVSHYADTEIGLMALALNESVYNPNAVMIENDPDKDGKINNNTDRELFAKRKKSGFEGFITDPELINMYS